MDKVLHAEEKMTMREVAEKINLKYNKVREIISSKINKSQYHNRWNRLETKK